MKSLSVNVFGFGTSVPLVKKVYRQRLLLVQPEEAARNIVLAGCHDV